MSDRKKKFLIACPVFRDELEAVLGDDEDVEIYYVDYRVHSRSRIFIEEFEKAIARAREAGDDPQVRVLIGSGCAGEKPIREIEGLADALIPVEKNCSEIFLGAEENRKHQDERSSVVTANYLRMVQQSIDDGMWTDVDARTDFGWFDKIVLADHSITPLNDDEIITLFDVVQVPIEPLEINLDHFRKVLEQLLS